MLTLFSRSFIVIHVGCDFCGSCEVRVARPLAKSCVSGGPSWCFLGNARPGPVKRAANLSLVLARSELQFHHQLDMHCWTCCIKSHWRLLHSGFHGYPGTGYSPKEPSNPREALEDLGGVGKKLVLKKNFQGQEIFTHRLLPDFKDDVPNVPNLSCNPSELFDRNLEDKYQIYR